jgi:hypothetical protein
VQFPASFENNVMTLITRITHSSGEWLQQSMTCPVTKPDAQGIGSSLSYMRRYVLSAVVGIYQDDDDGNNASFAPKERPATLTEDEIARIEVLAVDTKTELTKISAFYGKKALAEIERLHFNKIVEMLEKKGAKNE